MLEVADRFEDNPIANTADIVFQAQLGAITVLGSVSSQPQRELITATLKAIPGVVGIDDQLTLTGSMRSDDEILADVVFNIAWRTWANPTYVNAEVLNGKVILRGVVGRIAAIVLLIAFVIKARAKSSETSEESPSQTSVLVVADSVKNKLPFCAVQLTTTAFVP